MPSGLFESRDQFGMGMGPGDSVVKEEEEEEPEVTTELHSGVPIPSGKMVGKWEEEEEAPADLTLEDFLLCNNIAPSLPAGDEVVEAAVASMPKLRGVKRKVAKRSVERQKWLQNKVPYTYTELIAMAINTQADHRATLAEIYDFLRDNFECFRGNYTGWKNCIRHTLTLAKSFQKVPRAERAGRAGLGNYWALSEYFHRRNLNGRRFRRMEQPQQADAAGQSTFVGEDDRSAEQKLVAGGEGEKKIGLGEGNPSSNNNNPNHWEQQQSKDVEELLRRIGIPPRQNGGPAEATSSLNNNATKGTSKVNNNNINNPPQQHWQHRLRQHTQPAGKQQQQQVVSPTTSTAGKINSKNGQHQLRYKIIDIVRQQQQVGAEQQQQQQQIDNNNGRNRAGKKLDLLLAKMVRLRNANNNNNSTNVVVHQKTNTISSTTTAQSQPLAQLEQFLAKSMPGTSTTTPTTRIQRNGDNHLLLRGTEGEVVTVEDDDEIEEKCDGAGRDSSQKFHSQPPQLQQQQQQPQLQPQRGGPSMASIAQMSAWLGLVAGEMRLRLQCDGKNGQMVLSSRNQGRSIHRLQFIPIQDTELLIRQFIGDKLYQEKRWMWTERQEEQTLHAIRGICFHFFFCR